ncbi:hypothetical protein FC69_GL000599 [Latilactobacillus fuchuensis DSM 14340 = JCM 11249]|uniref:WxL domain-containing protein n=1 Tax=Latilactobacillus fuchuensis DSM 14340 = JCM 11249 TaxID=1423747 RepID=A0A0R1RZ59_9LACO|nr:hypothetical protein FC69_GL000599 [Latilactobacillus fuchuensis DSM 14340 = JCM 11249]
MNGVASLKKLLKIGMVIMIVLPMVLTVMMTINRPASVTAVDNTVSQSAINLAKEAISNSTPTEESSSVLQQGTSSHLTSQQPVEATTEMARQPLTTSSIAPKKVAPVPVARQAKATTTIGTVVWYIDTTGTLHLSKGTLPNTIGQSAPWNKPALIGQIKKVSIDGVVNGKDMSNLFSYLTSLESIQGLSNLKGATNLTSLFFEDQKLKSVDATNLDFSKVTSVKDMFLGCYVLETVGDTANWNLSQLKDMSNFFGDCYVLNTLNTTNWNVSQVTTMESTFSGCTVLTKLDVSNWNVGRVKNLSQTFDSVGGDLWLDGRSIVLDVSRWDTSQVTDMTGTFSRVTSTKVLDVSHWDTHNVTKMPGMFMSVWAVTELAVADWDVSKVTDMNGMFMWTTDLKKMDVTKWNTGNVTNMMYMFSESGLPELEAPDWDTSKVTDMSYMFDGNNGNNEGHTGKMISANLANWDTSKVTTMKDMFHYCYVLQHLKLGSKFRFVQTSGSPNLPEPSTTAPYYGVWQQHDAAGNQIGNTYSSAVMMTQYDGVKLPIGDYYWAKALPPTMTKLVRNVTVDGVNAPFKTETTAAKGDVLQYQVDISQPAGQMLQVGAVLQDVLDSHLQLDTNTVTGQKSPVQIGYANAGSDFKDYQAVTLDANGQFKIGQTMAVDQKARVLIQTTIKDDSIPQIDNLFKLVSGNYGAGTTSKPAIIHVKKPLVLTKSVKNETTKTDWAAKQDVSPNDQVGFQLDYQNTTGATSNQITVSDPLKNDELTYKPNSLVVTYQDGSSETISAAAEAQFVKTGVLTLSKSLENYETVTVTFSALVNPLVTAGTILHNSATISADNVTKAVTSNTVDMTVVKTEHQLTIRYVDLDEDLSQPTSAPTQIATPVSDKGLTGKPLSSILPGQKVAPKVIDGYTIYSVTEDADLTTANWNGAYQDDPIFGEQDRVITYGYKKAMLTINAPNSWRFGNYDTKQKEQTYYLENNQGTPQAVTVTDDFGVQNWKLQLSQEHQFKDDRQHELTGAEWQFRNGNVQTLANTDAGAVTTNTADFTMAPGQSTTLMTMAKSGKFQTDNPDTSTSGDPYTQVGQGSWQYRFGTKASADYSIGLKVPATTKRYVGQYRTQLTWSLEVAP